MYGFGHTQSDYRRGRGHGYAGQRAGADGGGGQKAGGKVSSIERVKTNVPKETGDAIRAYDLDGVKVDEDYRRYYPYDELASKVLGFTGGDNQGIVGLESRYESYLKGTNGKILTLTDSRGVELKDAGRAVWSRSTAAISI